MKTVEVKVYSYSELSDKAKEKAYYKWLESSPYGYGSDNEKTLKAFADLFHIRVKEWSYGGCNDYIRWNSDNHTEEVCQLSGWRLATYIWNNFGKDLFPGRVQHTPGKYDDKGKYTYKKRVSKVFFDTSCVLTGYCVDDDMLEPVYNFLKCPHKNMTFSKLMGICLDRWVKECSSDYESCTSQETFAEECENEDRLFYSNGYEFYE